jgi:hypothetical protein
MSLDTNLNGDVSLDVDMDVDVSLDVDKVVVVSLDVDINILEQTWAEMELSAGILRFRETSMLCRHFSIARPVRKQRFQKWTFRCLVLASSY